MFPAKIKLNRDSLFKATPVHMPQASYDIAYAYAHRWQFIYFTTTSPVLPLQRFALRNCLEIQISR